MGEILTGASAGLPLAGGFLQAQQARENAKAIERAAEFNALLATREASVEAARLRRRNRQLISSQRVAFAKGGIEVSGTALQFLADNAGELERDALNVEQFGRTTASLERARGRNARIEGRRRAFASLIGGATQASRFALRLPVPRQLRV